MSDMERAGVELFVDGAEAFRSGMEGASGALESLGDTALFVGNEAMGALASGVEVVGSAIAGLVSGGLAVAGAALLAFAGGIATGALEAEQGQLKIDRLARQLTAMGDDTDITIGQVEALGAQFATLAGGSDDVVIAIAQIGISSQAVSSEALPDFIAASLDLGAVMGDNAAAAKLLGKIYAEPENAAALLKRQNILLTEAQQEEIKALTEAGDKAGALAIVMDVLATNTGGAALANATTLSGAWGIFTTTVGEAFEELGANFLPLMQTLGAFIISDVVPAVTAFSTAFSEVIGFLMSGTEIGPALFPLFETIRSIFGPDAATMFLEFSRGLQGISDFVTANIPAMQQVFSDVFNAISVATFALVSVWDTSLAPAIGTLFTALFGQAPTAQEAMTGMLDAISIGAGNLAIWVTTVLVPAVQSFSLWIVNDFTPAAVGLQEWLAVNIPLAIQAVSDFWTNVLVPASQSVSDFWTNTLVPAFSAAYDYTMTTLIPGIQSLAEFLSGALTQATDNVSALWTTVLLPAFTAVQSFIADPLIPLFTALGGAFGELARIGSEILALAFNAVILPAMTAVNDFVRDNITPVLVDLGVAIGTQVSPAMTDFKTGVLDPMSGAFTAIGDAVNGLIGWLDSLTTALGNIHIPPNLTPGSPTPFELGLRGISSAIGDVTTKMQTLSSVNSAFDPIRLTTGGGQMTGGVGAMGQRVAMPPVSSGGGITYNNNVSVQANYARYASPPSLFSDITQGLNRARA